MPILAVELPAQSSDKDHDDGKPKQKVEFRKDRAKIRRKIQLQRARIRAGEIIRTHVQVRVKLRNGERMLGVVKNGRFVEKPSGLEFTKSDVRTKGAGLRLWYYNNTNGYIFIPYKHIQTYRVMKRLTDIEITEIKDRIVERERLARAEGLKRSKLLQDKHEMRKRDTEAGKKLEKLAKDMEAQRKKDAEIARLIKIYGEFPEKDGWGEQKLQEINLRRIAIGAFPDEKSRRFVEVFEDWQQGKTYAEKQSKSESKSESGGSKSESKDSKSTTPAPEPAKG